MNVIRHQSSALDEYMVDFVQRAASHWWCSDSIEGLYELTFWIQRMRSLGKVSCKYGAKHDGTADSQFPLSFETGQAEINYHHSSKASLVLVLGGQSFHPKLQTPSCSDQIYPRACYRDGRSQSLSHDPSFDCVNPQFIAWSAVLQNQTSWEV